MTTWLLSGNPSTDPPGQVGASRRPRAAQALTLRRPAGHIAMFLDGPTIQNIVNQLGANVSGFRPACVGYGFGA